MARYLITKEYFDAVLFDLDGVLTDTAKIHAHCWKTLFDEFLKTHAQRTGQPFRPFDIETDYNRYVDGKLRQDGTGSFLESRGIQLPFGQPNSLPDEETVWGLSNRKDEMVRTMLSDQGVEVLEDGVALARHLREIGIKTGVVSSSKNCRAVLESVGLQDLFETRVDGEVADLLGLPSKPAPGQFLEAARQLGVSPDRTVVVEDAVAGVIAGRSGGFGLVVGVARKGDAAALRENGADIVVTDLKELIV
ncbi:MAG: beta-phosphoglucomutase family hydrolase [Syntrophobacterales bacterium]|nr:MAG: beta-phosphoglucomutase family hydrolase [Syntrophobacterales bacterium]